MAKEVKEKVAIEKSADSNLALLERAKKRGQYSPKYKKIAEKLEAEMAAKK